MVPNRTLDAGSQAGVLCFHHTAVYCCLSDIPLLNVQLMEADVKSGELKARSTAQSYEIP